MQKVAGSNPDSASRRLENALCLPSSKMDTVFESVKDKPAKGEGWTVPIIC